MYRVLLVDDEAWILAGLQAMVDWRAEGFEICAAASNGVEAEKCALELRPDFILADIRMPGCDGLTLLQRLRQAGCTAMFAIVSGYAEFSYAQEAIRLGACGYLLKPIDPEKLQRAVARCRNLAVLPECITLSKNKKDYRIVKSEIVYIESYAHVCVFHTNDSEFSANIAISAVLPQLNDAAFARCHKSYIVNLAYVQKINVDYLLLRNGSVIPTGRSMRKQLHALYDEYLIRRVWEKRRSD